MFEDVGDFHRKFGLPVTEPGRKPRLTDEATTAFRLVCIDEEVRELKEAYAADDLPGIADALVDLIWFALGTAHMHSLPFEDLWAEVRRVNMSKERALTPGDSKRGSALDVVKPPSWQPPDIINVLMRAGWPGPPLPFDKEPV